MLLLLATLFSPVLAQANTNTSECLQMYRAYLNNFGASKFIPPKQMRSFIYQCMPTNYLENTAHNDNRQNQGIVHINEESQKTITVKT
ncbi:hypothetical protein MNBD_GAMMA05-1478 [hydrothermal vent metagenome]|uniref:Uncharacterized protein n=1 Tax=hydrothermal vent metagenome TaxID=652676 RepID=A0A3B0X4J5_9ZZZZ